jgi:hypothetical protein
MVRVRGDVFTASDDVIRRRAASPAGPVDGADGGAMLVLTDPGARGHAAAMAEWIYFIHPPRDDFAATMTDEERAVWSVHFERLRRLKDEGMLILAGPTLGRSTPASPSSRHPTRRPPNA